MLGDSLSRHWYYRSKAAALCRYVKVGGVRTVLDVGAGSGLFAKHLLKHTHVCAGVCVDTGYAGDRSETYCGKRIEFKRSCGFVDAELVLLMDVLEHVDDDRGLIVEYAAKVPNGAHFLITVPAFQWLWSDHDVFLEHYRRYDIRQLERVVREAGLRIEHSAYYFALVFPIALGLRSVTSLMRWRERPPRSHLTKHSRFVNETLAAICQAELPLFPINRMFGLSAFCLASKG
jgi:hypothetical protein